MNTVCEVPVDAQCTQLVRPGHRYPQQHYEKAFEYLLFHRHLAGIRLVHGTINTIEGTMQVCLRAGHRASPLRFRSGSDYAWVELPGNIVFDTVDQRFYDLESFYHSRRAHQEIAYTCQAAAALVVKEQHYGPWHPTKNRLFVMVLELLIEAAVTQQSLIYA